MEATHRVKDSNNTTVGFIVGKKFLTDYFVKQNIGLLDNLSVTKTGILRSRKEIPVISYRDVMKSVYDDIEKRNPYVRDIQCDLDTWRQNNKWHSVLQLKGPRQVGKTTELLKFAYSTYEYVIYVNMADDRYKFIDLVINQGTHILAMENYCRSAGLPHFVNSRNTLLIIDEIQLSPKVYNSIRTINGEFDCDLIVTGSYLGRILGNSEFFLAAGTVKELQMFPLSFKEFCRIFKADGLLETISLYGESQPNEYEKLYRLYDVYRQIGGYPSVIREYLDTKRLDKCNNQIQSLLDIFKAESKLYFKDTRETVIFDTVYVESVKEMCLEKRGTGNKYIDTVLNIANQSRNQKTLVSREEVIRAIEWLIYCGVIGRSNLYVDGNKRDISSSRRTYYIDCGIANCVAQKAKLADSAREGLLTETFAYSELLRLCTKDYIDKVVNEDLPCFSTYGDYELDFMILDKNNVSYGIEVKTTTGDPKSIKVYLKKKLVDHGIVAKRTMGGHGDKFDTIPIYTVGTRFPYKS